MTVTGELTPFFEPGTRPTGYCAAAVRVGRVVSLAAAPTGGMAGTENMQVHECDGTSQQPIAIAMNGGDAVGDQINLMALKSGAILPLIAGATDVVAGGVVVADATGRVIPQPAVALDGNAENLPFIAGRVGVALEDQPTTDGTVAVWLN